MEGSGTLGCDPADPLFYDPCWCEVSSLPGVRECFEFFLCFDYALSYKQPALAQGRFDLSRARPAFRYSNTFGSKTSFDDVILPALDGARNLSFPIDCVARVAS